MAQIEFHVCKCEHVVLLFSFLLLLGVVYVRTALELFMNPMGKALNVSQCLPRALPEYLIPVASPLSLPSTRTWGRTSGNTFAHKVAHRAINESVFQYKERFIL